jgi:hypothetical protein
MPLYLLLLYSTVTLEEFAYKFLFKYFNVNRAMHFLEIIVSNYNIVLKHIKQ